MDERQEATVTDPVDQIVPPLRGRIRLVALLAGAVLVLGLAAVAPMSGALRPNVAFVGTETGSAGHGAGEWKYLVRNRGWTSTTIERFDLGDAAVDVVQVTFLPAAMSGGQDPPTDPTTHGPVTAGPATSGPVALAPGEEVVVHLRFTYDCARRGGRQRSTVRARGVAPIWYTVDPGSGSFPGIPSQLDGLVDAACDHPG